MTKQVIHPKTMRELVGGETHRLIKLSDEGGPAEFEQTLIHVGTVQKSGAAIYFRPSNNDFICHDNVFESYREAYKSQDW